MAKKRRQLKDGTNPLAEVNDGLTKDYQRPSNDLIYEYVMRAGGEPFGRPFELSVQSLTEKLVKLFKQRGFFRFESLDRPKSRRQRNKFTRYAAAPFRGAYKLRRRERDG